MQGKLANKNFTKLQVVLFVFGISVFSLVASFGATLLMIYLGILRAASVSTTTIQLLLLLVFSTTILLFFFGLTKKVLPKLVLVFLLSLILFYRPYYPQEIDPEVAIFKGLTKSQTISELSGVESNFKGKVLASSEDTSCETGDYDWKRKDEFTKKCTYRHTVFIGSDSEIKQSLIQLESSLFDEDWKIADLTDFKGMEAHLNYTFNEIYGKKFKYFPEGYPLTGAVDLRDVYEKEGLRIYIVASEKDNINDGDTLLRLGTSQQILTSIDNTYYQSSRLIGSSELKKLLETNRYVVAISVEGEYIYRPQLLPHD